ncbi:MAG: pyridoxamine 5'-phosphate oxidase family protein [Arachidicoccus sp.]|nr:pyridoxamine 5'-phosphate oxidase family protein [Arachidicoccus sp.]
MQANLDERQIEYLLKHKLLGHLGCYADNISYVIPICYVYDGQYIYGRTYEGMKIKMIRKNPNVCFQVENIENMAKWQSAICWGEFEELTDKAERNKAVSLLRDRISATIESSALRQSNYWPFSVDDLDDVKGILFRIHINTKTGKSSFYDEYQV